MSAGSDAFADAPAALINEVTDAFSNHAYTVEAGEQSPATDIASEWFGAAGSFTRSAWWRFDATTSQATQVHAQRSTYPTPTGYEPDVLISVFHGTTLDDLDLVARGSLSDGGGVGDTPDYTPWVANWEAEAGVRYFIQVSSIYDEDINYRLTVVPTPTSFTGGWNNGEPVEFSITDGAISAIGVNSSYVIPAPVPFGEEPGNTAIADILWAGTGDVGGGGPLARLDLGFGVEGDWTVAWHRYDATWPSSVSYTGLVPDDEPALPAHAGTEWAATPQSPGISRHMIVRLDGLGEGGATDLLVTLKLAGYNLSGPPGTTYNPGFLTPGAISGLATLETASTYPAEVDIPLSTTTNSIAFGLIDHYSLVQSISPIAEDANIGVDLYVTYADIRATAVPQYRYTYADVPTTVAPVYPALDADLDAVIDRIMAEFDRF